MQADVYQIGQFEFDHRARTLINKQLENKKTLSPKESELLRMLLEHKDEVLPKSLALNKIWGDANYL